MKKLDNLNLDVLEELHSTLPSLPPTKKADVLLRLMEYIYPKRKPLDTEQVGPIDKHALLVECLAESERTSGAQRKVRLSISWCNFQHSSPPTTYELKLSLSKLPILICPDILMGPIASLQLRCPIVGSRSNISQEGS